MFLIMIEVRKCYGSHFYQLSCPYFYPSCDNTTRMYYPEAIVAPSRKLSIFVGRGLTASNPEELYLDMPKTCEKSYSQSSFSFLHHSAIMTSHTMRCHIPYDYNVTTQVRGYSNYSVMQTSLTVYHCLLLWCHQTSFLYESTMLSQCLQPGHIWNYKYW